PHPAPGYSEPPREGGSEMLHRTTNRASSPPCSQPPSHLQPWRPLETPENRPSQLHSPVPENEPDDEDDQNQAANSATDSGAAEIVTTASSEEKQKNQDQKDEVHARPSSKSPETPTLLVAATPNFSDQYRTS